MKGRKTLRRAGIVLGFGALLSAGMLASGALGMVSAVSSGGTDSSSTATDTAPPPADPTSTDASSSTSTPADTTGSTTTDATSSTTTTTPAAAAPSISTDKADYAPGSTVTLTGSGWGPGESVHIFVNDDVGQSWKLDVDVFADLSGNMTYQFSLPNFFVADYSVTATGASGQQARTTFTDAVQLVFSGKDGTNSHTAAGTEEDLGTVPAGTAVSASCPSTGLEVKVTGLGSNSMSWAISYVSGYADNTALSTPSTRTTISPATGSFTGNGTQCVTFSVSTTGLSAGTYHGELRVAGTGGASATPDLYFFKFAVTSTTSTTSTSIARTTGSNPSTFGDALTFTATVTGSSGNPSSVGSVTFKDGATVVCNAVALSGNTATCSPSLAAGSHSLTAEYSGAAGFTASTSSALAQTVNPKSVTITPDGGQSKVFGASDPTLTFTNNGGLAAGAFTGALSRASGESVGTYAINLGTLSAGSNYSLVLSATTVNFAITPKSVTITPDGGQSKVFGAVDPGLTFANNGGLVGTDFSGSLGRVAGENVGNYAITLGSLVANSSNYSLVLSATTVNFAITPKPVTITPNSGQSKVFGAGDPTLTFTNSEGLASGAFSGGLSRESGEDVGSYAITLGSLASSNSNYSLVLSATTVNFAITPKPVTITPDSGQHKVFGAADPTFTFTNSEGLVTLDFSGSLGRVAGENVGNYAITLGSLVANSSNYTLVLSATSVNFEITPKSVTITPDSGQHKVFGAADPTLTFTNSESLAAGAFSGNLGRTAGEDVGNYAITLGSLVANSTNYTVVLSGSTVNFEITKKSITITPNAGQSKVFGESDPALTFAPSPALLGSDGFTGHLDRASGENVGLYAIGLGTLSAGGNYQLSLSGSTVNFEITKKPITITPDGGQQKVFGAVDPTLTFAPSPALLGTDGFTGALGRASGENVGLYAINLGTLSAGGNYQLSLSGSTVNFEITKKQLSVNANDLTRVFGNSTPAPSASLTGFIPGQNAGNVAISGDASCTIDGGAGPDVGTYNDAIECGPGDLSAANYSFATGSKGKLTITKKPITITPDSGQHKVFGAADPALTFSPSPALLGSDGFTGALGRADGENVGSYAINLGALSAGGNYDLSLSGTTVNFAITKKPITITPDSGQSKVYGQPNPALTFTPSPALLGSDGFTGALGRATGENVGSYAINLGTLSAGGNYDLSLSGTTVNFAITKKQLAVNANDLVRTYLESTPAPSASFTGFIAGENAGNVTINGAASCSISPSAGPNAGTYVDSIECTPGTLSAANYSFATGSKGKLTINKANQTIAFPAIANKTLGSPDFDPGATASSGLGVSYAASPAGFCTIVSGNVHVVAIGACTVTASQSGSPNYNPAPDVARTFNVIYVFHGFFQPVDNDIFNLAQAGSAIPVKFDLNGDQGMNIFATGFPKVTAITCPSASTPVDLIEEVVAASTSGLQYGSGQYIYVWKTDKAWAGSCRQLEVKFADGVSKYVKVQFKK
jgi:hypothetical protein